MEEERAFGACAITYPEPRIAQVVIDRGDGRNPLSAETMKGLRDAARHLAEETTLAAVVLSGAGANFSVGADLKDPAHATRERLSLLERREALKIGPQMCQAWSDIDALTIAAIEGHCLGGGLALAIACDLRVSAQSANLALPEVALGLNLSWGAVPRLVNLVGPARAKILAALGRAVEANVAERWGLIDAVADDTQALAVAMTFAQNARDLPPIAMRMIKRGIDAATCANAQAGWLDLDQYALSATTEDYREAIKAFRDKRKPKFVGA